MSIPSCPGSGHPVTDGARVIVTRLRHEQRIGRCGGCHRLVLVRDGVAIEHLMKEVHADELGPRGDRAHMAADASPAPAHGSERAAETEPNRTRPRPSQGRTKDAPAAAPEIIAQPIVVSHRTLRERLKGRVG